jgi:cytochrome c5
MQTQHDPHSSPIKNWKQLVVVVVLAFLIPIAVIAIVTQLVTGGGEPISEDDRGTIERIKPVGNVVLAQSSGPKGQLTGEQVYNQVCKTCHEAGLAGAPKFGDASAWAPRIKQGESALFDHAVNGIRAMPPKGGNPDLDAVEVQRAVVFMANKSGGNLKEPAATPATAAADRSGEQVVAAVCGKCHTAGESGAPKIGDRAAWIQRAKRGLASVYQSALKGHAGMPARGGMAQLSDVEVKRAVEFMMNSGATSAPVATASAAAPAAPAASTTPPATMTAAAAPAAAGKPDGKKVFDSTCSACHAAGLVGAPKFGDKNAWAPRLKQGIDVLYTSALKGKNAMPPKGGNSTLSDAEVKAAVDYMASAAK